MNAGALDSTSGRKFRILMITPGPVPPSSDPRRNVQHALSEHFTGDLVSTNWAQTDAQYQDIQRDAERGLGSFGYHALRVFGTGAITRPFKVFWFFVRSGLKLRREHGPYDAIITYGPFTTGFAGLLLSRLMKTPLIVDMPGHPFRGFQMAGTRIGRLKAKIAKSVAPLILSRASGVKLLYPQQLDDLRFRPPPNVAVFHDFTSVSLIEPSDTHDNYVLLLGYPWFLKGVDILIRAFLQIASKHPDVRLKIVGHCPDREPFERLAEGSPRVELCAAVPHEQAVALMQRCRVFALPSRTEGMGRVILEAFAARKPVVASNVDGIPFIVADGVTGLIAESENVSDLAEKLDRVLSDTDLANQLASAGEAAVHARWSERAFATLYRDFVAKVVVAAHQSA